MVDNAANQGTRRRVKSQALYLYNAANQGTRQVAMAMWAMVEKITSRGLEDFWPLGTAKCRCVFIEHESMNQVI
jgi:hypothetical protein